MDGFSLFSSEEGDARGPVYSDEELVDAAFRHFNGREFPYPNLPLHVCMQHINKLATTATKSLMGSSLGYAVADTYNGHRFATPVFKKEKLTPVLSWQNEKNLHKAIRMDLKYNGSISAAVYSYITIVNGTQACSNFRPGFALSLYRRYCKSGDVVLDTSTGYGGRLVGFVASECAKYIGIDPNMITHEANTRMAKELGFADRVKLINLPAEDVPHKLVRGRCDFAFTSPPYFCKELYSQDDTQSWKRYPTAIGWRNGFLLPMMRLQFAALKPGCFACVNIADVKIKKDVIPLEKWCRVCGKKAGFKFIERRSYGLNYRMRGWTEHNDPGSKPKEVVSEPVLVFRKPKNS